MFSREKERDRWHEMGKINLIFPAFGLSTEIGLNMEIYKVNFRIQSECGNFTE